jgi:hypothetical protein
MEESILFSILKQSSAADLVIIEDFTQDHRNGPNLAEDGVKLTRFSEHRSNSKSRIQRPSRPKVKKKIKTTLVIRPQVQSGKSRPNNLLSA